MDVRASLTQSFHVSSASKNDSTLDPLSCRLCHRRSLTTEIMNKEGSSDPSSIKRPSSVPKMIFYKFEKLIQTFIIPR
jgi:hypothetical protein